MSIDKMVDRFLAWKLPEDFAPDHYISFDSAKAKDLRDRTNGTSWPIGTNLLNADQAKAMLEHVLESNSTDVIKNAEEAINLFLEYRDKHGHSEEAAKAAALNEFAEAEHYEQQWPNAS